MSVLEREKFGEDEMLREGFEEGIPKGIVKLRLVDVLKNGGYNEVVLDDGTLSIQVSHLWNWYRTLADALATDDS